MYTNQLYLNKGSG